MDRVVGLFTFCAIGLTEPKWPLSVCSAAPVATSLEIACSFQYKEKPRLEFEPYLQACSCEQDGDSARFRHCGLRRLAGLMPGYGPLFYHVTKCLSA